MAAAVTGDEEGSMKQSTEAEEATTITGNGKAVVIAAEARADAVAAADPTPAAKKKVPLSLAEVGRILSWEDTRSMAMIRRRPNPVIISEDDCQMEYQARVRAAMDSCGRVMVDEDFIGERKFRAWERDLEADWLSDVSDRDYDDDDDEEMDWDIWFPGYIDFPWLG